jgi:hypothetical protein
MHGWRKFAVTIYFGTVCFALCWFGRLNGTECVTVVSILAGLYKVSNVADKRLGGAG